MLSFHRTKKFLLTFSALSTLAIPAISFADAPAVTVGGFYNFFSGTTAQTKSYRTGASSRDVKFLNDTEIFVKADGKIDNGMKYGAFVALEADLTSDTLDQGLNAHRTYIYLENTAGRVEMGSVFSPARNMKIDASTIARGAWGVEGDWSFFANVTDVGTGYFLIVPELPLDYGTPPYGLGDVEASTKISYYTPEYAGFQLGFAYSPDSGSRGTAAGFNTNTHNPLYFEDIVVGSISYKKTIQKINLATSAGWQLGNAESRQYADLNAYSLGASANYDKFTVAASYGNWNDSGMLNTSTNKEASHWSIGGSYVEGAIGTSLGYFNGTRQNNDTKTLVWGIDYQLAPGLTPFGEVAFFSMDPADSTVPKNHGTILLLGTLLNF